MLAPSRLFQAPRSSLGSASLLYWTSQTLDTHRTPQRVHGGLQVYGFKGVVVYVGGPVIPFALLKGFVFLEVSEVLDLKIKGEE